MIFRALLTTLLLLGPAAVHAIELTLPSSASLTAGEDLGLDSYALPIGGFDGETVPARRFEGFVQRQAWRVDGTGVTPLQVLQPLRDELTALGYTLVFECKDDDCGGFDFRFGTEGLDAPNMIVDLDDFLFLSALQGDTDSPSAAVSLLVSRSRDAVYVQIIQVSVDQRAQINVDRGAAITGTTDVASGGISSGSALTIAQQLDSAGYVVLDDLVFATGSADLGTGPFDSLARIAAYLADNPTRRIALVGHTDAVGGLDGNIALSKRRATSVKQRLIQALGVPEAQLTADGVGFLSPVASNLKDEGRKANRRVEAVLISTR